MNVSTPPSQTEGLVFTGWLLSGYVIHFIFELLAGLEGGYLRRSDLDLLVRSGIESRACGTIAALKCTEADQLYRAAGF